MSKAGDPSAAGDPFHDRVALVTGAGSGMGRELARELYARGARLVLCDVNEKGLAETSAAVPGSLDRAFDVRDAPSIARLAEAVRERFGRLDLLFNNAGVGFNLHFEEQSEEEFDLQIDVNFRAPVRFVRAFLPLMKETAAAHGGARIVNTSSLFGIIAPPGNTAYSASKFALAGFSQALHGELAGTGVAVSVVHPGGVATGIGESPRYLERFSEEERADRIRRSRALLTMPPDKAARTILAGVARGRRRIVVGNDARMGIWLQRLVPVRYWDVAKLTNKDLR